MLEMHTGKKTFMGCQVLDLLSIGRAGQSRLPEDLYHRVSQVTSSSFLFQILGKYRSTVLGQRFLAATLDTANPTDK